MSVFFEMMVCSSLVMAFGLAACWWCRRQPAALRHGILAGTMMLAAAQPAIHALLPAWQVPAPAAAIEIDGPTLTASIPEGAAAATAAPVSVDWVRVGLTVWLAGAAAGITCLGIGAAWLMWLGSRATPAGRKWNDAAMPVIAQLGIRRPVRILITTHPALLVTWGAVTPVILLPEGAACWSDERVRLVLAHELAHLARRDWLIQLAAELIRAVNWFNPLYWIACNRLRRESEHACDDVVLDLGIGGPSYASHLVDLARAFSAHGRTWLPAPSMARPSTLERRVRAMLNPQVNRGPVPIVRRLALAALLLAVAVPIAAAARGQSAPSGTVTDPSGRPLGDAGVRLASVNGEPSVETRTDAGGHFTLPAVPAGDYVLSVRSPGFSTQRQRVSLTGGGVTFALRLAVGTLRETVTVKGPGSGADGPRSVQTATRTPVAPTCSPADAGKLTPPRKLRDARPRYLDAWTGRGLKGEVLMQATIGVDGKVRNIELVSSSEPDLEEEAIAAVSLWEFSPTYLNCEAVEVRMFATVRFTAE
jgi:TonB family protein